MPTAAARPADTRPADAPADRARAARLFHALSDETRLAILELLQDGEHCVCDLQDALEAAQSRLSFHLKVLREAGLVTDRKEGRWSYYAIAPEALAEVHDRVVGLDPGARRARGGKGRAGLRAVGSCCG
jgi:ArsR family transcriptional regulator